MSNNDGILKLRSLTTVSAAALALALAGGFATSAKAQDQGQCPAGETMVNGECKAPEIVVTGSRIVRRDYTSASPIVTLNSKTFENTSTGAIETNLNKLPQFQATLQTEFTSGDVQNTVVNTPGSANVSLRGLGPNRNLVLVDGRRAMPTNGAMLVDVNSIPAAMIDRVEVITGGASAVYGADAISGVVNFILKKDFQGISLDGQYSLTELGDDREFRTSAIVGGNFGDDRGNATLSIEHYSRSDAPQSSRDYYKKGWLDPTTAGSDFWGYDTYFNPAPFGVCVLGACPAQTTVDSIFSAKPPGTVPNGALFYVNQSDGTVYTGMPQFGGNGIDSAGGAYRYNGPTGFTVVPRDNGAGQAFKTNVTDESTVTPLTRYSAYGTAHYDFTDWLTGFVQANFSQVRTTTLLANSPAVNAWGVLIPHGNYAYPGSYIDANGNGQWDSGEVLAPGYGAGQAYGLNCATAPGSYCTASEVFPTPPELNSLLNSRTKFDPGTLSFVSAQNDPWDMSRNLNFLPERGTDNSNTTWQVTFGFDGKIPSTDWTWEIFGSHGRSEELTLYQGFASLANYRAVVTSPNYGKGYSALGNSGPLNPGNAGFAGGSASCTSGLPIFGALTISKDCIAAITANLQNLTFMEQNVVEGDIQGGLFDDWAGTVSYSLGASYREDSYVYEQDNIDSQNNANDSTIGLFPSNNTSGYTDAKEVYGELLLPVLSKMPLVQQFNFELGYRYSDYNTVGGVNTYKILADYTVNDWIRFRGGYNHATRAPNIGELFQAKAQTVAFASFGDPCSQNPSYPVAFSAASTNATQAAAAKALCSALMGPGAAAYYGQPAAVQPADGFALALPNTVGNPDLGSEKADTWTAGIVLKSPFNNPLLSRTTMSIDWYNIRLSGLITAESQDQVYQDCLDLASNPSSDPTTTACQAIIRDQLNGSAQTVNVSYINAGSFKTDGVDVQLDWAADVADFGFSKVPGTLSLNVLFNHLDSLQLQPLAGGPFTQYAGTVGPTSGGLDPYSFRYKIYTTLGYTLGPANVQLKWRHLPSLKPAPPAAAGANGPNQYDEFDLSANYALNKNFRFRAGIDNLLDVQPQNIASNTTPVTGVFSTGNGVTAPGVYDVLGRRFYFGATINY